MITTQHVEEDLSRAYVQAIAARARLNLSVHIDDRSHDYGIDGTFHQVQYVRNRRKESGFKLDFQLKACKNAQVSDGMIKYDLESETYNNLIDRDKNGGTPVILLLLVLPDREEDWLEFTEDELILRKCCYWKRISGNHTKNSTSIRIEIPSKNRLTPEILTALIEKVAKGEELS